MDPVTGIGLAASVVQLVTFSIDAVKKCRELYQQGSTSEYNDVDYTAGHLASLTVSLQQSLEKSGTRSLALTREEKDLVDLAKKCGDCASTIQKELRKLQIQPRASALEAARKAARVILKKGSISKIQEQLETYRSILETSLLSRLSQRFDAQGLRNDKSFISLDKDLQHIVSCLANSQTSLTTLVAQESEQTRLCITAQIDRVEKLHIDDRRYEEVVNSLFYPDISSRQEQVDNQFDGIKHTYDWIFEELHMRRPGNPHKGSFQKQAPRWDDFARWLRSGHGVYWINGKAGSGKSTLMNHICNHNRKLELLGEWCSDRRLLTPTFFFWNAGTRLQKSIDGLLRSLVYQMLKDCRELIECFNNEPLHTWTQKRLLATLLHLSKQSQVPVAICMFIDGLDEFDGSGNTVINTIKDLADQTHVKVCVSSRPLLDFEEAFSGNPSLKLQELTFESIREYAEDKLSKPIQKYISLNRDDRDRAESLLNKIVERADGVFLWAIIAIRDVHDGLRGIADLHELAQTIERLPSELESLFLLILNKIKPIFKRDTAKFLEIILYEKSSDFRIGMDLCSLHLCYSQSELGDAPIFYNNIATKELTLACKTLQTRLQSHTAGLLELTPTDKGGQIYGKSKDLDPILFDLDPILFTKIDFLHRSVRDFLLNNDMANSFLALHGPTEAQVRLSIARGTLARIAQFSQGKAKRVDNRWPNPVYFLFLASVEQISLAERILGKSQKRLMQSLSYESLARGYCVTAQAIPILVSDDFRIDAFRIDGQRGTSIDLVGMAAAVGMTFYVCEQLDLSIEPRNYSSSLPDLNDYARNKVSNASLAWSKLDQSHDLEKDFAFVLRSSAYRSALGEYLHWKVEAQSSSETEIHLQNNLLVESYILACCTTRCHDLVRILLRAGANPMVQVGPSVRESYTQISFWHRWLSYLLELRRIYISEHGKPGGVNFHIDEMDRHVTLNDLFNTTKALLAQGADINYWLNGMYSAQEWYLFKGQVSRDSNFNLILNVSATFILEECFNAEPEFREFMIAIEPLVTKPTRKIARIYHEDYTTIPDAKESEMLLHLIEKWESTGHRNDQDAIEAALDRVWKAQSDLDLLKHCVPRDYESDDNDSSDNSDKNDSEEIL